MPDERPAEFLRTRPFVGLAVNAALASAAVAGLGAGALYGGQRFLARQAAAARRVIYAQDLGEVAPYADKVYGKSKPGRLDLLVLGDSIAAGLGADRPKDTLGARLAKGLSKKAQTSVRLRTGAVVGAETSMVLAQVGALPPKYRPDIAVVIVGGNDVTHRIPTADSVRQLGEVIDALTELGASVVVGTCPDVRALRPVPQPLRSLGSRMSRQLADAQRKVALERGARVVSLAHVVGPFFLTAPDEMFSLDQFHPSAAGYRRTAKAMLPSVLAAAGVESSLPFGHHAPFAG